MRATNHEQVKAAVEVLRAVAETIQTVGEIPSGELYTILMPKMNIETYQRIIGALKGAGLIREVNHLLIWSGPCGPGEEN